MVCVSGIAAVLLLWPALASGWRTEPGRFGRSGGAVGGSRRARRGRSTLSDVTRSSRGCFICDAELYEPFWNPYQFSGAPFWANASARLLPLHLLFVALPLQLGLVILPWLRVTIAGWRVACARELGIGPRASLIAAIVFPLSGMVSSFLLSDGERSMLWVLVETERLAQRAAAGDRPDLRRSVVTPRPSRCISQRALSRGAWGRVGRGRV